MHRLRVLARKNLYIHQPPFKRLAAFLAMLSFWPLGAAVTSVQIGVARQMPLLRIADAWWLAMRYNVPPKEYFLHQLWRPERRARLDDYLYWSENGPALTALNRAAGWRSEPCPVSDKRLFTEYCQSLDLPSPELFGVWQKDASEFNGALPHQDLWLKPTMGSGGVGAECWSWKKERYWKNGVELTPEGMMGHIAEYAHHFEETLVQEVLHAHPDHVPHIGIYPLCARIITGRRKTGVVEIIDAMAIWPRDGCVISQGGHIAMVDVDTGRIGAEYLAPQKFASHELEDAPLSEWQLALEYVRRGHRPLSQYVFLGWDVAFSARGPVLLEANSGWGCFHFQVLPDHPIADTRFVSIAEDYLQAAS